MSHPLLILLACALSAAIMARAICVLYQAYHKTHSRGLLHFILFGYSHVALGAAAATALVYVATGSFVYGRLAVWLFLFSGAGMILFDRRHRR